MNRHPLASATALMTTAALLFSVMAILAKGAAARLPGPEIAFVRFSVGLVAVGIAATRMRLRAHNWRGLGLRGVFGGSAVLCYFLAIQHLTVGMATLLNYTAPVFAALWAWLFLGERIALGTLGALAVTTAGVAVVIVANAPPGAVALGPWQCVGILSAVLSGAAIATIREVRKTDGAWEIFAAFCVAGALFTGVPAARHPIAPTATEWLLLGGVGVTSVVAQLSMTQALRDLPAAAAGVLFQLTPVSVMVLGRFIYGERPNALAIGGAAVTLSGVIWGAYLSAAPQRVQPVPPEEP
ncbi:MAG TPA: DMT family transporter [Polyangia bacterium]|jgi:drug/metabolite transporter (DMT)-like permease